MVVAMHVMIATDGSLDSGKAAALAARLAGDEGRATVFTVVEVPRGLLAEMRAATEEVDGVPPLEVEYQTEQAETGAISHWVGDDAVVARFVNAKVKERTEELAAALAAAGVDHTVVGEEGENAARAVLDAVKKHEADILCIGTHGLGRFEGLLGSASTKLARLSPCSVVLVR